MCRGKEWGVPVCSVKGCGMCLCVVCRGKGCGVCSVQRGSGKWIANRCVWCAWVCSMQRGRGVMCACMCSVNYGLIWTARVSSPHSLHIPPPQETLMVRLLILKNTMTIWLHGYTAIWLYGMTLGVTSDHTSSCIQHTSIYIKQHHHINTITMSTPSPPSPCQHHRHHHPCTTHPSKWILGKESTL